MGVASRSRQRNQDLLKGGLDMTGHHAPDLEERERWLDREAERREVSAPRRRERVFLRRCVVEHPLVSVAAAVLSGVLVGCVLGRVTR